MLRGLVTGILLLLNMLFWGSLVFPLGILKLLLWTGEMRRRVTLAGSWLAEHWVAGNNAIFDLMLPTRWDVSGIDITDPRGHYLIISNHVSWVDIFTLFRVFHGRAAFIRFFLKHQLIWFPIAGQACWALEFPFMHRYTPEYLEKHPEKRGRDLDTTRRVCRHYRKVPVAILNFLEGTRFRREKHADQESPYRHLLRPRIGGISFVLAAFAQERLDAMIDVTLAYPGGDSNLLQFITGRLPQVIVRARRIEVPAEFFTSAVTEPGAVRDRFKEWVDTIWRDKDALLDQLVAPPSTGVISA